MTDLKSIEQKNRARAALANRFVLHIYARNILNRLANDIERGIYPNVRELADEQQRQADAIRERLEG